MHVYYRQFDHTGDVGLEIFASNLRKLFENAAMALYDIMTDYQKIKAEHRLDIQVSGDNSEELLVAWLTELNFNTQSNFWLFCEFEIHQLTETALTARVWGEKIDLTRHQIELEIKAITFHKLQIVQKPGAVQARIILDI